MMKSPVKGFTLIEIMVALAIITIALGAIIESTSASTSNAAYLREKTVASWVAMNQISLFRAKRQWGSTSNKTGTVDMAGAEWRWKMKITKTDDPNMRRLDVDVYLADGDSALASLSGFMARL